MSNQHIKNSAPNILTHSSKKHSPKEKAMELYWRVVESNKYPMVGHVII
jgi:hypothetical protein